MDRRSLHPSRESALLWRLARLFRRERPDLVHGFTIKCAVYGSLAARMAGVPARVNSVAGMGYVFTSGDAKARLLRPSCAACASRWVGGMRAWSCRIRTTSPVPARATGRCRVDSPDRGFRRGRAFPAGPVVPRRRTHARAPAARLLWDKGPAEYAEAAKLLRDHGLPIDLLLAGEPDPGNPSVAEKPGAHVGREGLLQWLGHVRDMPALLRSVDVVALPSYREGLPKG